jgi:uncharacterized BrkB/YihY/UPF0761 family membrane protein
MISRLRIPLTRIGALINFHVAECATNAAAIAYHLMIVFFPSALLVKALPDTFGIRDDTPSSPIADIEVPSSIVNLVNGFLRTARGLTGYGKSVATIALVLLVLIGLSRVFSEYHNASALIFGRPRSYFRTRVMGGISAVLIVSGSIMLFLALNSMSFARQPHILRNYGTLISTASTLISFAVMVGSVAFLVRLVSHGALSRQAIWSGALFTVAGWIIVSLGFLQLDFYFSVQQRFYGAGAAIIAMLLWFYIIANLMILGLSFARFVIDGKPVPKSLVRSVS